MRTSSREWEGALISLHRVESALEEGRTGGQDLSRRLLQDSKWETMVTRIAVKEWRSMDGTE